MRRLRAAAFAQRSPPAFMAGTQQRQQAVNASPGQVTLGLIVWLSAVVFSVSGDERR
jgi:hypothetical protein